MDTLAWARYKAGRLRDADWAMRRALRLGTRDARLYYHAGMIARALGDRPRARHFLALALRVNPYFHVLHADAARRALAEVQP